MDAKQYIEFWGVLEKLKCNTRHSWTSTGRHETVAAHSWRLAAIAMMLRDEAEDVDMDKVLEMCLIHDFGEAVTGDIPAFEKSGEDDIDEALAVRQMIQPLPEALTQRLTLLFDEMDALETREARFYKALDKLEAVLQHNESPLDTWLPLEYDLQQTYGVAEAEEFPCLKALRSQVLADTLAKIAASKPSGDR